MLSRRFTYLFLLLVIVSLIAAQCGAPATEAPAPAEPAAEEPAAEAEQVAEFTCEDAIGCVDIPAGDPIRVGYALVISGPNETLGVDSRRGVEIAIDDKPEVLGHPVELVGEDSLCSAEGGQTALTKLVSDPSLVAIIGTNCSSAGEPASKIASDAGMVLISPSNTAPSLTDPEGTWNPGYLRTAHNDKVQGRAMAEFALNVLGVTSAAAIHDGDPYTEGLARVFADVFAEMGGDLVAFEAVGKGDTDMHPALMAVSEAGPPEFIYDRLAHPPAIFRQETAITKARLDHGLAVIKVARYRQVVDIVACHGGHLPTLHVRDPIVRVQDIDVDILAALAALDGGGARVTGCRSHDDNLPTTEQIVQCHCP